MLDLTHVTSAEQLDLPTDISDVGVVLVRDSVAGRLGAVPIRGVGALVAVPDTVGLRVARQLAQPGPASGWSCATELARSVANWPRKSPLEVWPGVSSSGAPTSSEGTSFEPSVGPEAR